MAEAQATPVVETAAPAAPAAEPGLLDGIVDYIAAQEQPKAEPAKAEPVAAEPAKADSEPDLSKNERVRWAALAREEKRLREERQATKAEREQAKAAQDAAKTLATLRERVKADPLGALKDALGVDYLELGELVASAPGEEKTPQEQLAAVVEETVKRRETEREKADREAAAAALTEAKTRYRAALETVVSSDKDGAFELCAQFEGIDLAHAIMEQHLAKTGDVLPLTDALSMAERHYEERARKTRKLGGNQQITATGNGASDRRPFGLNNNDAASSAATRDLRTDEERTRAVMKLLESSPLA